MGKKIYVGNLSYSMNDESLVELFAQFGQVETARIVTDRETGRSKGFAFVEMTTEEESLAAIQKLNGFEHSGRALNVSEAKPMAPKNNNRSGGRGGFGLRERF